MKCFVLQLRSANFCHEPQLGLYLRIPAESKGNNYTFVYFMRF